MVYRGLAGCLLLLFATISALASTTQWLSGNELGRYCGAYLADAESDDGAVCIAFLQGFLAGADTDGFSVPAAETFAERAARTRLGDAHLRRLRKSTHPGYCVGKEIDAAAMAEKITAYLEDQLNADDLTASELVHRTLAHHFPCDE